MYRVYWTYGDQAYGEDYENIKEALDTCHMLRNSGRSFVTMVSEDPNQVGAQGVDSVEDGLLPSGEAYTWKKRR